MSVSIRLLPLALAAAGVTATEAGVAYVRTRMRDPELLRAAAEALAGSATVLDADRTAVVVGAVQITFTREGDGLTAHFTSDVPDARARALVDALDHEYARAVQEAVYRRLAERAARAGMRLIDERVEDDNSIVLTLRVTG